MTRIRTLALLRDTLALWDRCSVSRLAAALAFYTVLSLAPFAVLVVRLTALLLRESMNREDVVQGLQQLVGPEAAQLIRSLILAAHYTPSGLIFSVIAFVALLYGASSVFVELRSAMNLIWGVKEPPSSLVGGFLKDRLYACAVTIGLGVILIASLGASVLIQVFRKFLVMKFLITFGNILFSFLILATIFALLFRYVPARRIAWHPALIGGVVTTVAFGLARIPLDLYLSYAAVGSAYGAAASVIVFLFWVYVAAQIFYTGSGFAYLLADSKAGN